MDPSERRDSRSFWSSLPLGMVAILVVLVGSSLLVSRPDRPRPELRPGSSPGPAFFVQILRPRMGLPLGGLLPPSLFGLESRLGFESESPGASITSAGPRRIELAAEGWELLVVVDEEGQVTNETWVSFELVFEERARRVIRRPGDPATGTFVITLQEEGEIGGSFDIELARCEDANTGKAIGWPPQPLVLHGSFDRLPYREDSE